MSADLVTNTVEKHKQSAAMVVSHREFIVPPVSRIRSINDPVELFTAERNHRINLRRPSRRYPASQQQRDDDERQRVSRADAAKIPAASPSPPAGRWQLIPALTLPALARRSSPNLPRRLPRMINALRVCFDFRQREPRRFEFALGVKRGLIQIMRRIRIGALTKN